MAGRRAHASKPCTPLGSTPPTSKSSGGFARSCRCSCGRMSLTFRWANIGSLPPIARICSTCCPAASRYSGASAEPDQDGARSMAASSFGPILEAARTRIGAGALEARLSKPRSTAELKAMTDDRYLSQMELRIFRAGLKHSLVDAKWPAFEEVFHGFEPRRVRAMSDDALQALMSDTRLIRHWGKLKSVRDNAAAMIGVGEENGSFAAWLADWPATNIVELWEALAKRFSQMGGNSGPSFLRMAGKDTFVLTHSVTAALKHWGAVETPPKNRKDRAAVQSCFNAWAAETGRPLCHLSMILAASVED